MRAASGGPLRRPVELGSELIVGADRRCRQVPGARVREGVVGKRPVSAPAFPRARAAVDDAAQEGVGQREAARVRVEEAGRLAALERLVSDAEIATGGDHRLQGPIPGCRGDKQQRGGLGARARHAAPQGLAQRAPGGARPDRSAPRRAAALRTRATAAREAPAGCRARARAWTRRPPARGRPPRGPRARLPEGGREGRSRPRRPGQARSLAGPGRDQECGTDVVEAARGVTEALGRGSIEPVGVVNQDQERAAARGRANQAEEPGEHREPLVDHALAGRQRQRGRDRRGLRLGQVAEPVEHRRAELAEGREREPRLRLDA